MTQSDEAAQAPPARHSASAAGGPSRPLPGRANARIDGRHEARRDSESKTGGSGDFQAEGDAGNEWEPAPWTILAPSGELLERHASELADRLQTIRQRLDRREAVLNARQAQLESEMRAARLRDQQRREQLGELETTRERLFRELEAQRTALSAAEISVDQDLNDAQQQLQRERGDVERRQAALQTEHRRLTKQADRVHVAEQRLQDSRSQQTHELQRARQELQLESVATQLQSARLLRQAERAAAAVEAKQQKLEIRRAEWSRSEHELEHREQLLLEQTRSLAAREHKLQASEARSQHDRAALDRERRTIRQERTQLHLQREQLKQQRVQLEQRESQVQQQVAGLEQSKQAWLVEARSLDSHREALDHAKRKQQQELAEGWSKLRGKLEAARRDEQSWREELARQKASLKRREDELSAREVSLQTMRRDLKHLHVQTLEVRLAIEELLALAPTNDASLKHWELLPKMRRQVAEAYQQQQDDLNATKQSINDLLRRLGEQKGDAAAARHSAQQWFQRRQSQIEVEAARLIARQHEIDQQARAMRQQESDWEQERLQLQGQIRQLASQPQTAESPATWEPNA